MTATTKGAICRECEGFIGSGSFGGDVPMVALCPKHAATDRLAEVLIEVTALLDAGPKPTHPGMRDHIQANITAARAALKEAGYDG